MRKDLSEGKYKVDRKEARIFKDYYFDEYLNEGDTKDEL